MADEGRTPSFVREYLTGLGLVTLGGLALTAVIFGVIYLLLWIVR